MNPTSAEISQTQIRFLIEDSGAISHPFSTQDFPKMGFQIDVSRLALSNYWSSVSILLSKERLENLDLKTGLNLPGLAISDSPSMMYELKRQFSEFLWSF